jgi:hypothetical protein
MLVILLLTYLMKKVELIFVCFLQEDAALTELTVSIITESLLCSNAN